MAETLALGKLKIQSPPGPGFFDRTFMINDGFLYAQYFLGWPALMMPFAPWRCEHLRRSRVSRTI